MCDNTADPSNSRVSNWASKNNGAQDPSNLTHIDGSDEDSGHERAKLLPESSKALDTQLPHREGRVNGVIRKGTRIEDGQGAKVLSTNEKHKNATLERETSLGWEALLCVGLLIVLDVSKLASGYALQYHGKEGRYPIQQTLIVFFSDFIKLSFAFISLLNDVKPVASEASDNHASRPVSALSAVRFSLLFAIPSAFYGITNNLTYYAFHYTTPAVWLVLTQIRVLITALVYRFWFGRAVSRVQWFALTMLICGILLTKIGRNGGTADMNLSLVALLLALICSFLSVAASISMEYLFKNDARSFMEQQLQLYLFSSIISFGFVLAELARNGYALSSPPSQFVNGTSATGMSEHSLPIPNLIILVFFAILMSALAGLLTGTVIKRLDNIVKIYAQGLCGVFNAILCSVLFPDKFTPDIKYAFSLVLVLSAIFLYERKYFLRPPVTQSNNSRSSVGDEKGRSLLEDNHLRRNSSHKELLTKKAQ